MISKLFILMMALEKYCQNTIAATSSEADMKYGILDEHNLVTDNEVFPFVAAILKKSVYLSAGALICDDAVLSAADALYMIRESTRILRVRLGSINYKKGGVVMPVKYIEFHPFFEDNTPAFDVAIIRLSNTVVFTSNIYPIRLRKGMGEVDASHFIVTSWQVPKEQSQETKQVKSMELIKRQRILTVTHLHPSDDEGCTEELQNIGVNITGDLMCLDTAAMIDPCVRDVGAPVVLNGVLWGIVSSWIPEDCENGLATSSFVTLVSTHNVSQWIHTTINGHTWIA